MTRITHVGGIALQTLLCCDSVCFHCLGIITEMGVVTMQMCDASKGGYQEPDSDGIVRFKAHGPINRETRHGVTELRLRY